MFLSTIKCSVGVQVSEKLGFPNKKHKMSYAPNPSDLSKQEISELWTNQRSHSHSACIPDQHISWFIHTTVIQVKLPEKAEIYALNFYTHLLLLMVDLDD